MEGGSFDLEDKEAVEEWRRTLRGDKWRQVLRVAGVRRKDLENDDIVKFVVGVVAKWKSAAGIGGVSSSPNALGVGAGTDDAASVDVNEWDQTFAVLPTVSAPTTRAGPTPLKVEGESDSSVTIAVTDHSKSPSIFTTFNESPPPSPSQQRDDAVLLHRLHSSANDISDDSSAKRTETLATPRMRRNTHTPSLAHSDALRGNKDIIDRPLESHPEGTPRSARGRRALSLSAPNQNVISKSAPTLQLPAASTVDDAAATTPGSDSKPRKGKSKSSMFTTFLFKRKHRPTVDEPSSDDNEYMLDDTNRRKVASTNMLLSPSHQLLRDAAISTTLATDLLEEDDHSVEDEVLLPDSDELVHTKGALLEAINDVLQRIDTHCHRIELAEAPLSESEANALHTAGNVMVTLLTALDLAAPQPASAVSPAPTAKFAEDLANTAKIYLDRTLARLTAVRGLVPPAQNLARLERLRQLVCTMRNVLDEVDRGDTITPPPRIEFPPEMVFTLTDRYQNQRQWWAREPLSVDKYLSATLYYKITKPHELTKSAGKKSGWKKVYAVISTSLLTLYASEKHADPLKRFLIADFAKISGFTACTEGFEHGVALSLRDHSAVLLLFPTAAEAGKWACAIDSLPNAPAARRKFSRMDIAEKHTMLENAYKKPNRGGVLKSSYDEEWSYYADGRLVCSYSGGGGTLADMQGINTPPNTTYIWDGEVLRPAAGSPSFGFGRWDGAWLRWFRTEESKKPILEYLYDPTTREYLTVCKELTWKWTRHFLACKFGTGEWIMENDVAEPVVMFLQTMRYFRLGM